MASISVVKDFIDSGDSILCHLVLVVIENWVYFIVVFLELGIQDVLVVYLLNDLLSDSCCE